MTSYIKLNKAAINNIDLTPGLEFLDWTPQFKQYLNKDAGEEHYKLLNYLAKKLSEGKQGAVISDVGTFCGSSALAFALAHPSVSVVTYDIMNPIPTANNIKTINNIPNIKRKYMSCQLDIPNIVKSDLVLLDMETHDGKQEKRFVELLMAGGYKGVMVVDDINTHQGMRDFWSWIPLKKLDVTQHGHWTGTGIVVFDPDTLDILV